MVKRIGGTRRKKRCILRKSNREKGKISLSQYLQNFEIGERVKLSIESAVQNGMYHPRFYGKDGIIKCRQGRCYEVMIDDGGKQKILIVHPVHLQKSKTK